MSCLNCQYINPLGQSYFKCKVAPSCPATQNQNIIDLVRDDPIKATSVFEIINENLEYFGICYEDLNQHGKDVFDQIHKITTSKIEPFQQIFIFEFVTDDGIVAKQITDDRFLSVSHIKSFVENILYDTEDIEIVFKSDTLPVSLFSDEYTITI